ncbi:MAG: D-alanine--D-alanine ligase [Candidatus Paraimprobicoccus trichonymphae]|uniref:D-alanine--D-alanine ligase n=1 Tax=Candidatus Paraimprobicoccus trichonymphae TaxID=3033793 RepID=A0AA48HZV7_9FIRM|nr:MAG: D-alanine--D-alanine ligase [Candidatus Paraimprobicoccus trichonymphae]
MIIFGGNSTEHEVSIISASNVIKNISKEKYNLFLVRINKKGEWYLYSGDINNILNKNWENDKNNKKVLIFPNVGIVIIEKDSYKTINIDVAFPVLHGKNGEDGTIQGLLKLANIPVVGCETASSAVCMDKIFTNSILKFNNINKPDFMWFYYYDFEKNPEKYLNQVEKFPVFIKPANSGSSIGVNRAYNKQELENFIKIASGYDEKILVENAIIGQEVECSVIGNEDLTASILGEIVTKDGFYDYDGKYINDTSELIIPARLSEKITNQVKNIVLKSYKILGCKGFARVDLLVEKNSNEIYLNEINTIPGFTTISMYPKLMNEIGYKMPKLIDNLVDLALKNYKNV